ncbi:MAG TPA: glycosyltransferase family 1 protein [Methylomirabilota bacterium]|nr:glycosyltransferase family 1 protein [Methylomirabilota bacterium]
MPSTDRPIRVGLDAHVVGRRKTGNETYLIALATGLAARPDIDLTAYLERDATWPRPTNGMAVRRLRTGWPQLRIPLELPVRARLDRVDLLHVQYVAPPIAGVPVVTAIHDVSFEDEPDLLPALTRMRLQATVRLAVRSSAVVVTPSHFSRARLLHHYDLDPDRVVVTPNGVLPPDGEGANRSVLLAAMGVEAPFVLQVGNLQPRKNVPRLIAAIAEARAGGVELELILAGQRDSGAREVDSAIARHQAEGWVRQVGYVDDERLAALYAAASVVAYVSVYEGFGLPVLEAMSRGTPVVAANRAAIPEVAGDAALLVDPYDVHAIAEALATAAADDRVRDRLRIAGPARAAAFSVTSLAEGTMRAYRTALARR